METLPEPAYGKDCLYIYLSRKFDNTVPYTLEAYKSYSSACDREQYLAALGVGAAGTAIVSGLVYFFGWLVGWIFDGLQAALNARDDVQRSAGWLGTNPDPDRDNR